MISRLMLNLRASAESDESWTTFLDGSIGLADVPVFLPPPGAESSIARQPSPDLPMESPISITSSDAAFLAHCPTPPGMGAETVRAHGAEMYELRDVYCKADGSSELVGFAV